MEMIAIWQHITTTTVHLLLAGGKFMVLFFPQIGFLLLHTLNDI